MCFGLAVAATALSAQGLITIAGRAGVRGYDGDGKPATSALLAFANLQTVCDPNRFEQASHISVDNKGNIYFADSDNQRIRRIDPSGTITTVAGSGEAPQTNARCEPTRVLLVDEARLARVQAYTAGYERELPSWSRYVSAGAGAQVTMYHTPPLLAPIYGERPVGLQMFFRLRLVSPPQ